MKTIVFFLTFVAAWVGGTAFGSTLYGDEASGRFEPYWGHALGFGLVFALLATGAVVLLLRSLPRAR